MEIWRDVIGAETVPRTDPSSITIGTFDGVHLGHQHVLAQLRTLGRPVVAVTFDPHPTTIFAPNHVPRRLTTLERRVELLLEHGADEVRVLAFDREMASWSPQDFVQWVIVDSLQAAAVMVGENFRFGSRAAGDVALLTEMGRTHGFTCGGLDLAGDAQPWSSTRIRALIADGAMVEAAQILGRPHEVVGEVVRGQQRGREIGYPTANTPVDDGYAVPPDGVYAGRVVRASGEVLTAAISIGTNPTFGEHDRRVESYVLDRDDLDLYGERIRVELVQRLRGMVAFDGLAPLLEQMARDVADTRRLIQP